MTVADKCCAWGCKNVAITYVPDPAYADVAATQSVPWVSTCGEPIQRSRSGLTFIHERNG